MDLSSKTELKGLARALGPIATRAHELRINWLLIGAAGRDVILGYMHGMPSSRATFDVDVAIQVASWAQFHRLNDALISEDGAQVTANAKQRLIFPTGVQIDLVPFGSIEENGEVAWPPESDPVLDVRGLREAYESSTAVILPDKLEVRVPTVEHYLCLKLLAWHNRHLRKPKHDSVDLADVFGNAEQLISLESLYDQHESTLQECEHDPTRAVLQILGERLKNSLLVETRGALMAILHEQIDEDGRLELVREFGPNPEWLHLLRALLRGLS